MLGGASFPPSRGMAYGKVLIMVGRDGVLVGISSFHIYHNLQPKRPCVFTRFLLTYFTYPLSASLPSVFTPHDPTSSLLLTLFPRGLPDSEAARPNPNPDPSLPRTRTPTLALTLTLALTRALTRTPTVTATLTVTLTLSPTPTPTPPLGLSRRPRSSSWRSSPSSPSPCASSLTARRRRGRARSPSRR